ncbi:hypothetical protein Goshw_001861 [Gossypium schwendimanii]|uniref:Uncharacterized protein n=1 Tax=Gossypium schwendimanii TaxID=34291 RepID=A0A7J9LT51_GOSSC|nr:hypothetical protein [Gossypium schwendimanii]
MIGGGVKESMTMSPCQVIPSELEIIKQNFEREVQNWGKR